MSLDALATDTHDAFQQVYRDAFQGDPLSNPRLRVEVVEAAMAGDTPTLVLITPWTISGMAFPPDGELPDSILVGLRSHPMLANELPGLGSYHSISLMSDVSKLESPASARSVAKAVAPSFREGIVAARAELTVPDPSRRALFRTLSPGERGSFDRPG